MDLNHRPPGPEEESQNLISAASGVAYGITDHLFPFLNWTDVGPKSLNMSAEVASKISPLSAALDLTRTGQRERRISETRLERRE